LISTQKGLIIYHIYTLYPKNIISSDHKIKYNFSETFTISMDMMIDSQK